MCISEKRKRKLAPRFIGPFRIYAKRSEVAYALALPDSLLGVYNVFHVLQLKRCLKIPTKEVKLEEIGLNKNLSHKEHPIAILDFSKRKTRTKTTKMVKVQWSRHSTEEATWEVEDKIRKDYPHLFEPRYPFLCGFQFGEGIESFEGNKNLFFLILSLGCIKTIFGESWVAILLGGRVCHDPVLTTLKSLAS